jgi:hypothetical protein
LDDADRFEAESFFAPQSPLSAGVDVGSVLSVLSLVNRDIKRGAAEIRDRVHRDAVLKICCGLLTDDPTPKRSRERTKGVQVSSVAKPAKQMEVRSAALLKLHAPRAAKSREVIAKSHPERMQMALPVLPFVSERAIRKGNENGFVMTVYLREIFNETVSRF